MNSDIIYVYMLCFGLETYLKWHTHKEGFFKKLENSKSSDFAVCESVLNKAAQEIFLTLGSLLLSTVIL